MSDKKKLKIPAGLYDAMFKIQKHCQKHDGSCFECCFNEDYLSCNDRCVLRQMPEDWADFDVERVSSGLARLENKKRGEL
jgi:hypothetical protein